MDSWTPAQLAAMFAGGNKKMNDFMASKGVTPSTAIRQKYNSDAAALYKLVLKARVAGEPEPTEVRRDKEWEGGEGSGGRGRERQQ